MFPIGIADSLDSLQPLLRFYCILHSSFGQYLDCYFERSISPSFTNSIGFVRYRSRKLILTASEVYKAVSDKIQACRPERG
jgi:hypothetical protein